MNIIDAQVHTWERDTPEYPWHLRYADPARNALVRAHFEEHIFPMHELIAAMDAAGVHAGIATVPSIYGSDNRYSLAACARYPDRLAMIALHRFEYVGRDDHHANAEDGRLGLQAQDLGVGPVGRRV